MNFSYMKRIIRNMKSIRKFVALLLLLWTPLFFSGAAYAATQMELANATTHEVAQKTHSCHESDLNGSAAHHDIKHPVKNSHCQHCSFCTSFAAPLNELVYKVVLQTTSLAFNAMWVSSTHNITPDHRPPIDA